MRRLWAHARFRIKYSGVPVIVTAQAYAHHSQAGQDAFLAQLLADFLPPSRHCWVVDVGCNDPEKFSNSLYFERVLGCRTLAIDPLPEMRAVWARTRPDALFVHAAVSARGETVTLHRPVGNGSDDMLSSLDVDERRRSSEWISDIEAEEVPSKPLSGILAEHQISDVLFMSIDVEGAELEVLSTIDFAKVNIHCFLIENNTYDLFGADDLRAFLAARGYRFIARLGYLDDVFAHASIVHRLGPASMAKVRGAARPVRRGDQ